MRGLVRLVFLCAQAQDSAIFRSFSCLIIPVLSPEYQFSTPPSQGGFPILSAAESRRLPVVAAPSDIPGLSSTYLVGCLLTSSFLGSGRTIILKTSVELTTAMLSSHDSTE